MADQIQWDEKSDTSGLVTQSKIQWDEKPDTSELAAKNKPGLMSRADTAITDTLAPNPQNYESLAHTNLIEVPKTLGREVYSAGKTAAGMLPSVYHAFADEPTEEEKASQAQFEKEHGEAPGTESTGLKRVGLGIERMTTAPLIEAGRTYANPATRPTLDQVLSVAPEAIGQGAGTVIGGKLIEGAAEKVPTAAKGAVDAIKEARIPKGASALGKIPVSEPEPVEPLAKYAPKAAESVLSTETAAPSLSRLEAELNKGLGNEPIKPGVPLREQMTAPEAEPRAPRTQFEAANGKELDTAISKEFPDEKAAKDVRDKIHKLTNVQARELAINLELDLGQDVISRAKQSGGISRGEVFKRLLDQGYTADDLSKAIDQSKHLPPAQSLIKSESGEAKIPFTGKPKATVPKVIDQPYKMGRVAGDAYVKENPLYKGEEVPVSDEKSRLRLGIPSFENTGGLISQPSDVAFPTEGGVDRIIQVRNREALIKRAEEGGNTIQQQQRLEKLVDEYFKIPDAEVKLKNDKLQEYAEFKQRLTTQKRLETRQENAPRIQFGKDVKANQEKLQEQAKLREKYPELYAKEPRTRTAESPELKALGAELAALKKEMRTPLDDINARARARAKAARAADRNALRAIDAQQAANEILGVEPEAPPVEGLNTVLPDIRKTETPEARDARLGRVRQYTAKPSSIVSKRTLLDNLQKATEKLTSKERPEWRSKRGQGYKKPKQD